MRTRARSPISAPTPRLLQLYSDEREHSYLSDAQYVAAMQALLGWIERGEKPTAAQVAARCRALDARFEPANGCRIVPDYRPAPLAERSPERRR